MQDAYSLRSSPQVAGAARDALKYTRSQIEIELNGVGDNPIFFPDDDGGTYLTGANFQGTPMAFGLEMLGTAVTTVAVLSERRLNRLLNRNLSCGLPAFLTKGAGMFSGLMLAQYTAGALCCENRILSHPGGDGLDPRSGRSRGLRLDGDDDGAEIEADSEERTCRPRDRDDGRRAGDGLPPSAEGRQGSRGRLRGDPQARQRSSRKTARSTTTTTGWPRSSSRERSSPPWRRRSGTWCSSNVGWMRSLRAPRGLRRNQLVMESATTALPG